ncbi:MAG: hypothetical protein IT323_12775 [Anaerolineae bacterium]|nr:hypothetical protein [Anaerolineae bacterium]
MRQGTAFFVLLIGLTLGLTACGSPHDNHVVATPTDGSTMSTGRSLAAVSPMPGPVTTRAVTLVEFSLETGIVDGRMAFVGVGGAIDGVVNPDLVVPPGSVVHLTVINGDGMPHDLAVPDLGVQLPMISGAGATSEARFLVEVAHVGTHSYFCTVAGHRQAGMEGRIVVTPLVSSGPP